MFIDASAIIAIIAKEKDGNDLLATLDRAPECFTSPVAVYEASLGLARVLCLSIADAEQLVADLIEIKRAEIVPIRSETCVIALEAFSRFGKGRHPAKLNMGDCFAYACAKQLGVPLLFKGDNFAKTDIEVA
ncbi:MAG: type II toxin-antitoxin system VapC family toxin [Proteobacteria bacterium]|nr:type II toxin-antitoxin system VapC family toxin [Pseudomonadota bacterium]